MSAIAPYVSSLTDDVFALHGLPEEVIAVLFAYYSRSREPLRENLARLLADQDLAIAGDERPALGFASDKARAFHERWVVGYGHASVAEHAVVHLAIENVSILASKAIEDARLCSFTEKSTRYVVFDQSSFVDLPELPAPLRDVYRENGRRLFATYLDLMPKVTAAVEARCPGASPAAIRAQACDLLRGLLPAGTRTNLGLTANARSLEGLLSKLLSSPLAEVQRVGADMHRAALTVAPTLVKYAAPSLYRSSLPAKVKVALWSAEVFGGAAREADGAVRVIHRDHDALSRIALALAYDGSDHAQHALALDGALNTRSSTALSDILRRALLGRGPHDAPPRAFEASSMTFEIVLDYGAYRDLQRHRLLTPAVQRLTCALGHETPGALVEMGLAETYDDAMLEAHGAWLRLKREHPLEAQYAVPLGYRVRVLWTLNLRELFHVIELRSAKQGHASYRRIAQDLYRAAVRVHPWLEGLVRVDLEDYGMARQ